QTDVSTSSTTRRPLRVTNGTILAHRRQVTFPQTGTSELQNSTRLDAADKVLQRTLDGTRVCSLSAQLDRFLQQLLTNHKICAFHVYSVYEPALTGVNALGPIAQPSTGAAGTGRWLVVGSR